MALGRPRAVHGRLSLLRQCEGGAQVLLVADCTGVVQVPGPVSAGRAGGRNW